MGAILLVAFVLFFIKGIIALDPDFGWHVRIGQIIGESGIPKTDPLSYTMPSFPFVDHEWLANIIIAKLYVVVGIPGLAAVSALLATLALALQVPSRQKFVRIPLLLAVSVLLPFTGIRPQVITWVFFSSLLWVLLRPRIFNRYRLLLPLFFLVWANLHGGFAVGLVALFVVLIVRAPFIFLLCLGATLVNPYGLRLWEEVVTQTSHGQLRFSIAEWLPAIFIFNLALWTFLPTATFLIWRYREKYPMVQRVLFIGLLLGGLSSIRHMPLWMLMTLSMMTYAISQLSREAKSGWEGARRFQTAQRAFLIIVLGVILFQTVIDYKEAYSFREASFYPKGAVAYLKTHPTDGEIFSPYEWGGYMSLMLPGKRVFVDGRMPSWRWDAHESHESNAAFEEYSKVINGKIPLGEVVRTYGIDTVLLSIRSPHPALLVQLTSEGWREIFKDTVVSIYKKSNQGGTSNN